MKTANSRKWGRTIAIVVTALILAISVTALGGVVAVFWWYGRGVAELDEARLKNYRPSQVTRIFARDGELIGELYRQRRTVLTYEDIPKHVENAFLAAEDADFYKHKGMDYAGMVRALIANLKAGEVRQGASTLTQQVVKIFMLSSERTFERKVQELILARRLERAFTKEEILQLYLNEIYLGHGRYGIEEASRFYFGRGVAEIDLGQAALLATLPKAPGRDSPLQNPERAKQRQQYVLDQMVAHGFAFPSDIAPFYAAPLVLAPPETRSGPVPGAEEFVDEVERQLVAHFGQEALDSLGAEVHATVSLPLQRAARTAAFESLRELDQRNHYARGLKPASEKEQQQAASEGTGPIVVGRKVPAVVRAWPSDIDRPADGVAVRVGAETDVLVRVREGSRYDDPEQSIEEQFPEGATIDARITQLANAAATQTGGLGWAEAEIDEGPECAVIVTDVPSGEVLIMVGGSNYARAGFNRATAAKRQPGSSFKPFVYGAALMSQQFTAASLVSDSPEIYEKWRPTNFTKDTYRGDIRVRAALTDSINTVAIKLLDRVGVEATQGFAKAAGIESDLIDDLSLALGTSEVTLFELARAYSTLARGGSRIEPRVIQDVRVLGDVVWEPTTEPVQALPEDVVFVLTSMMESVVEQGTGIKAKTLGRPVAGKTGTSSELRDAWFAGFTRERSAVAWVGFDTPKPLGKKETGGSAAIPVWLGAMTPASEGPAKGFEPPASVIVRRIDAASGLLAPTGIAAQGYSGQTLEEYFLAGTVPVEEAVPAALPAGDVLLNLYANEASMAAGNLDPQSIADDVVHTQGATAPAFSRGPTKPSRTGHPTLPSLDDDR